MIGSVFFIFNRMVEITFLIPIVGMLVRSLLYTPAMRCATHANIPLRRTSSTDT